MPTTNIAHHIKRTAECLALASLAVGFSVQAAMGQISETAAAAALVGKLSLAGLCFAYAKARERESAEWDQILRAGEAMLESSRYFIVALATQFLSDKMGLIDWHYLGWLGRILVGTIYLLAFSDFIRGFDLLGEALRRRRQQRRLISTTAALA